MSRNCKCLRSFQKAEVLSLIHVLSSTSRMGVMSSRPNSPNPPSNPSKSLTITDTHRFTDLLKCPLVTLCRYKLQNSFPSSYYLLFHCFHNLHSSYIRFYMLSINVHLEIYISPVWSVFYSTVAQI